MDELQSAKKDAKLLIENEIQKFIDDGSASLMVFQNTYRPLSLLEINEFMGLMINRYSHKVKMKSTIDLENFTVHVVLEKY